MLAILGRLPCTVNLKRRTTTNGDRTEYTSGQSPMHPCSLVARPVQNLRPRRLQLVLVRSFKMHLQLHIFMYHSVVRLLCPTCAELG